VAPRNGVTFGGSPIASAVPVGVAEGGNLTVYFEVLSYAGTLTLTAIVDPDHFPDLGILTDGLRAELDVIIHHSVTSPTPFSATRPPSAAEATGLVKAASSGVT
jgi:hypothetical protein